MIRIGLVVNPVAGLGGRVGLKGTDGAEIVARALELGARPLAGERAAAALAAAHAAKSRFALLAAPGVMGAAAAETACVACATLDLPLSEPTGPEETRRAARALLAREVDLLVFAGGDGTARDILAAVGERCRVVGIPAGVKMHSAVHAVTPAAAGRLIARVARGEALPERLSEVMDIDEAAFREGRVSARLYGYLRVPQDRTLFQSVKSGGAGHDRGALQEIGLEIAERMADGALLVLGPGTTTRAVAAALGQEKTLLGVDLFRSGRRVAADATEAEILAALGAGPARIVVTPIGGQGHILGRGNQQISPAVIERVGIDNLVVVASMDKIEELAGRPLLVDTGDPALDARLAGYRRVVVGRGREIVMEVAG